MASMQTFAGSGPVNPARNNSSRAFAHGARRSWQIRQILLLLAGLALYLVLSAWAEGGRSAALDHAARIMRFEQRAWFFVEPDIQHWLGRSETVIDVLGLLWFALTLPMLLLACVWLMARAPAIYFRLRNALALTTLTALLAHWLFPTAQPPAVPGSGIVHLPVVRDWPLPPFNEYAAMPSAQGGWVLATGLTVWIVARQAWWRWLVWAGIAATFVAAVATGQHLVLDLLTGGLIALIALGIVWHHARFRVWWREWMVPDASAPSMIATLRRDRWAAMTVLSLAALTGYLAVGWLIEPGFTDYWLYMMAQIIATIVAVIWLTHRFGPENGLHPITLSIVVLVTYLDTLGTAGDLYARYDVYDKITHTGGGAILAAAIYDLVASLRQRGAIRWRVSRQVSFAILLAILLGALWELYEFAGDAIFNTGRHSGRIDTLYDLISDSTGAIVAALLLAWVFRRGSTYPPAQDDVQRIGENGSEGCRPCLAAETPRRHPADRTSAPSARALKCSLHCGILAPIVLGVTVVAGGWVNPGYSQMRGTISDLWEQGRAHAEFVSAGLVLAGLLIILFGAGLHYAMPGQPRDVSLAFALYGVAIMGSGVFQDYASRPGRVLNLKGFLHNTWSWLAVGSLM
ncbi:MAG: phosphatase PAP2 family protein, partial [Thermomicrobiales bacterium]|nr:phosphatase PAP2 family protein [Thermomicrobiales bacterium]